MSLHHDLADLTVIFSDIAALDRATKDLDYKRAKEDNIMRKTMYEFCRDQLNLDLEYKVRLLRNKLNNYYAKNEVAYWRKENDSRSSEVVQGL